MSEVRRIGRHTLIYGAGIIASKLVSFIMLPVYTRYLSTADYGVLELLGTTIDVIGMIGGLGLAAGMFKYYAEAKTPDDKRSLISTLTIGSGGISLVIALLGILASPFLTKLLFGESQTPLYFQLFFLIFFFQSIGNLALAFVQAEERSQLFVALNVAKLFVTLALTIVFVVELEWSIRGVLLANLIANVIFAIGMGIYTFMRVGLHFSGEKLAQLARFGAPVALWTIGSFILTFSDRYFLNAYTGASAVGVYSLAYKFSFLLGSVAVAPFTQIWEPRRFVIAGQPDADDVYRRMFLYLNLALFVGSVLMVLFVKDTLIVLVHADFVPAYHVVPLLVMITVIQQWTGYCNFGLFLKNATHLYGLSALIGVVAALGFNAILIPPYGIMGAAWATLFAYSIRFVPVYFFSQKKYHVNYSWTKVAVLWAIFGLVIGVRQAADGLLLPMSLAVSTVTLAITTIVVYLFMLNKGEQAFVRRLVRRPFATRTVPAVQDIT